MAPPKQRQGKKPAKKVARDPEPVPTVPVHLQQLLLNAFKNSFDERLGTEFKPLLQEVKGHLFNRDFSTAFGRNDYLEVYAARWSPSRALGYLQVFDDLKELEWTSPPLDKQRPPEKVVCIGGGAGAELVALGGYFSYSERVKPAGQEPAKFDIACVDIADWTLVVNKLHENLTRAPPLSQYASAAAKAANAPLLEADRMNVSFHHNDVLNSDPSALRPLFEGARLITIMFTLNELYSTSLSLTQKFLLNLTECLREGAQLLVVDSPGSYSTVNLNGAEKKYPMQWLLDHTLLKQGAKGDDPRWEKLTEDESKWFRLSAELRYPIELENMRFQLHLYKRTSSEH